MEHLSGPLNLCHVLTKSIIINRTHMLVHAIALSALIYYRASFFFKESNLRDTATTLVWFIIFLAELGLSFLWLLSQAFRWRPVRRTAFPERLPEDEKLPPIDVFVCTADPEKEPTVDVMNTVVSAMALNYPPEKLHVYLSDDGGSPLTLHGTREAHNFARWWLPFCKRYGIKTRCPKAYFREEEDGEDSDMSSDNEFDSEKKKIKVVRGNASDEVGQAHQEPMPQLIYVSREKQRQKGPHLEKQPSHHHHFKAGALNVLLRVSGVISNSPYILVLDCDMYCNDPSSARQAMCFHLDPRLSRSLMLVQFPQRFHNISENDIYDGKIRTYFWTCFYGMDGLKGPVLSGTCFYIKRESLYRKPTQEGSDLMDLKKLFGHSNEFIKYLWQKEKPSKNTIAGDSAALRKETQLLASCGYENGTKWGQEVGFMYYSVVEDYFTSFTLHCKGWTSVFYNPPKPQFLGTTTANLNDMLIQGTRWFSGLSQVGISRFCPLIYGSLRMPILQSMCYAEPALFPFYCLPICCFATVPQICLVNGISIFPEVSSPYIMLFAFIFLSSLCKHLYEVVASGFSVQTFLNEQRIWMIKSTTSYVYGTMDAVMTQIGMRRASFLPTNKVDDDEQSKRYEMGIFDFQTSIMFLAPMVTLVILNMTSFIGGVARVLTLGGCNKLFLQIALSFFVLLMSYPVIEAMVLRTDKGRIPGSVTILSTFLSSVLLLLCSSFLM
ncbi:hypothetical protein BT93_H0396 [Corymbia citriodora subsp. variegata]|nr:hypothetical protein BT93_H0396 [Corymbia citriodora subsp. variegata]